MFDHTLQKFKDTLMRNRITRLFSLQIITYFDWCNVVLLTIIIALIIMLH